MTFTQTGGNLAADEYSRRCADADLPSARRPTSPPSRPPEPVEPETEHRSHEPERHHRPSRPATARRSPTSGAGSGPAVVLVCGGSTDRGSNAGLAAVLSATNTVTTSTRRPGRQRRHAAVRGRAGGRGHRRRDRGDRAGRLASTAPRRAARLPSTRPRRSAPRSEARHLGGAPISSIRPAPAARHRRAVPQAARRRPSGGGGRVLHGGGRPAPEGVRRVREDSAVLRGPGEDRPHSCTTACAWATT